MCLACAEGFGAPVPVTDEMRKVRRWVEEIYALPDGGAGGYLHVEIDDMNLEDNFFSRKSRKNLMERILDEQGQVWFTGGVLSLYLKTFDGLAALTLAERATVCERSYTDGFA